MGSGTRKAGSKARFVGESRLYASNGIEQIQFNNKALLGEILFSYMLNPQWKVQMHNFLICKRPELFLLKS
jgi:hypothetical protein